MVASRDAANAVVAGEEAGGPRSDSSSEPPWVAVWVSGTVGAAGELPGLGSTRLTAGGAGRLGPRLESPAASLAVAAGSVGVEPPPPVGGRPVA
eukprot:2995096-Lingulodinium_polyedra.AAC.1